MGIAAELAPKCLFGSLAVVKRKESLESGAYVAKRRKRREEKERRREEKERRGKKEREGRRGEE